MSWEQPLYKPTALIAAADLSAKQYYCVEVDSAGKAALSGAGELVYGILQNKPTAADRAEVMRLGVSKAVAGAAIAVGAEVASDAAGKIVTATTGDRVVGIAREAAAADGNIIAIDVMSGAVSP